MASIRQERSFGFDAQLSRKWPFAIRAPRGSVVSSLREVHLAQHCFIASISAQSCKERVRL